MDSWSITKANIVKVILKHIKPRQASQLQSKADNVEELVHLGHQLIMIMPNNSSAIAKMQLKPATSKPQTKQNSCPQSIYLSNNVIGPLQAAMLLLGTIQSN